MVLNYLSKTVCDEQLRLSVMVCKVNLCILPNIHKCSFLHVTKLQESPEMVLFRAVCVCVCVCVCERESEREREREREREENSVSVE